MVMKLDTDNTPATIDLSAQGKIARQILKNTASVPLSQKIDEDFYIFYSFDLTNSTQFKIQHPDFWVNSIRGFFAEIKLIMQQKCEEIDIQGPIKVWRLVGDEVLFYQKIITPKDCFYSVPLAKTVLNEINATVQKKELTRELLSVKATVWCARAKYPSSEEISPDMENTREGGCRNYIHIDEDNINRLDFLGPDIDTGFRLANLSTRNRLIVSADLAYLYQNDDKFSSEIKEEFSLNEAPKALMKIVCLQKLKGVWAGRSYPIIWFEEDWDTLDKSFQYDDEVESDFLYKIKNQTPRHQELSHLLQIYDERGCTDRMTKFMNCISQIKSETRHTFISKMRTLEFHCAPVCVNEKGEILVAKRPSEKNIKPNHWEFGCGQLDLDQTIEDCLVTTCQDDFGITVSDIDGYPPLALKDYWFKNDSEGTPERKVPGVTFAIYCPNCEAIAKKHTDVKWINSNNARQEMEGEDVVDDFWDTIDITIKRIQCDWNLQPT